MEEIKKKKLIALYLGIITCFGLGACGSEEPKPDFEVSTNFSFYQDGGKKEKFETNQFEINTKIYVCVDFTITKNVEVEDFL